MNQIIVLSGPISSGKSTLAGGLETRYGAVVVRTREYIGKGIQGTSDRESLQVEGDRLDREAGGKWIVDAVTTSLTNEEGPRLIVIDSARTHGQVQALREQYGRSVIHVHLTAPLQVLATRYEVRKASSPGIEFETYAQARVNETEAQIGDLERDADISIDSSRSEASQVLTRAAARLGLFGSRHAPLVDVMIGGQYGSEGKGNVAAYLAPEYDLLVRSGGPNAGHSVWKPDGVQVQHHLPSGTTVSNAQILLTAGAVIHPNDLLEEIGRSDVDDQRLFIDPGATIIEDHHVGEEDLLKSRISSTGSGVGAATANRIMGRSDPPRLAGDVPSLKPYLRPSRDVLSEHFASGKRVFVEGTQGTGLSLFHGNYPHVTSRDTTVSGILGEAGIPPRRIRRAIMVVRTYPIRVADPEDRSGTSGNLYQELTWDEIAERSGLDAEELRNQELTTRTRNLRRVGEFDWDQLAFASEINAPTDIALTFVDQLDSGNIGARRFDQLAAPTIQFIEEVERVAGAPVSLVSTRFHQRSVIDRRAW